MGKAWRICVAAGICLFTVSGVKGQMYSKRAEFPALKMSYEDLNGLFRQIYVYVQRANAELVDGDAVPVYSLSITDNIDTVSVEGPDIGIGQLDLPGEASYLTYEFYNPAGRIAQIRLVLSEYVREIEVKGSDRTQVNGLHALVTKELESHASYGGRGWGILLAIVVSILGTLGLSRASALTVDFGKGTWVSVVGAYVVLYVVWSGPMLWGLEYYHVLFPRFALYTGDVAFYKRYSAEIGLLSLGLSVVGVIATFLRWVRKTPISPST